ncbi:tail protein X [Cytobacillus firmus]|uniref:phage tail protein n=1 Tax=Cytobacillus firmus TaxID=1399 RepID=UPI0018CC8E57|nr:phage tail protein [Cytobacillus firmus]MED1942141.1 phage tail protein [Cytobacillus firmus]
MKTYTTKSGDMFDKIALAQLGSEYLFPLLLKANPEHRNTIRFSAGIVLNIPEIQQEDYPNLPEWLADDPEDSNESDNDIIVLDGIDA